MKKTIMIIMILALALFAGDGTFSVDANWSKAPSNGEMLSFVCTVDSLDTLYSAKFSLAKYDDWSFETYPPGMIYLLTSATDTPKVSVWVQGSMDGSNWFVVDTLLSSVTSEAIVYSAPDLNNKKCKWYRLKVQGIATNSSDTSAELIFYLYKEE